MKLTLIRGPEILAPSGYQGAVFPLSLAYLAGYLRAHGHEVQVIDAIGESLFQYADFSTESGLKIRGISHQEIIERIDPSFSKVIGLSCMFSKDWPLDRNLVFELKKNFPTSTLVAGGEHISALTDFCRAQAPLDFCINGEGEKRFLHLIHSLENDQEVSRCSSLEKLDRISTLKKLPRPAWDLLPIENYLSVGASIGIYKGRTMPILASRGCPYSCTFCSSPQMWTTKWVAREPIDVVDEMQQYYYRYGATNFDFCDLTAIIRKDWILQFCDLLKQRNLPITYQFPSGTRSEALSHEVVRALVHSGCCSINYSPDTGSMRMVKKIRKAVDLNKMVESMRAAVKGGAFVKANFVMGYPGEGYTDFFYTFIYLIRLAWAGVHDVWFSAFTPYPGSVLHKQLRESGQIAALNDEYFLSLAHIFGLSQAPSYCKVPGGWLHLIRLSAMTLFYVSSMLFHPFRLLKYLKSLKSNRADTRIEMFIQSLIMPKSSHQPGSLHFRRRIA